MGWEASDASTGRFRRGNGGGTYVEEGDGRNTGSPVGGVARANRQPVKDGPGRMGWRRGPCTDEAG